MDSDENGEKGTDLEYVLEVETTMLTDWLLEMRERDRRLLGL